MFGVLSVFFPRLAKFWQTRDGMDGEENGEGVGGKLALLEGWSG